MNNELTLNINGLDEIQSSLNEIKDQFLELTSMVEKFSQTFRNSNKSALDLVDTLSGLSSTINIINNIGDAFSNLGGVLKSAGQGISNFSAYMTSAAGATQFLSSNLTICAGVAGLAIAAFLIFSKWGEMSDTMRMFAVSLGIASVAILAYQAVALLASAATAAFLAPILAVVVVVGAAVAAFMLFAGIIESLRETDYDKQVKAETEAIKDQTDALKEQSAAYDDLKSKRQDATYEALAESEMNQRLSEEIMNLSAQDNKTAEEKERLKSMVEELNSSLGTNLKLTADGNALSEESVSVMNKEIEASKARALAEVVAAELKEQYTQVLKASNEIRAAQVEQEELLNGRSVESLTGAEKKKYEALEEKITAAEELRTNANTQVEELEDLHNLALTGKQEEFTKQYMEFTGVTEEIQRASAYSRQAIDNMMYEGMNADEADAMAHQLEMIQKNGGDINQLLDESGKLRKDVNLQTLVNMNVDLEAKQKEAVKINSQGATDSSNGYITSFTTATEENQPQLVAAVNQNVNTQRETLGLNDKVSQFGKMANEASGDFNTGIIKNVPETEKAMGKMSQKVTGAFNGKKLPKLTGSFRSSKLSAALGKIAGLFGFDASPGLEIVKAASGGLIEPGQFFLAREAGPELVGTIGSKTAVMNNNQIVDAVSNGVYRAVTAAMGGGGGNYTFHITNAQVTCAKKYQLYPLANPS